MSKHKEVNLHQHIPLLQTRPLLYPPHYQAHTAHSRIPQPFGKNQFLRIQNVEQIQSSGRQQLQSPNISTRQSHVIRNFCHQKHGFLLRVQPQPVHHCNELLRFRLLEFITKILNHNRALKRTGKSGGKASLFSFLLILMDQSFGLGPKMTPPLGEGECAGNHDGRDRFSFEDKASDRHHGPPRG
ncbi:UNVERIFIED_CONTAM: hypothetical protein Sradi_6853200 [Sesamum radiatum]|uniref:Uncharacterized protein n=1 Tax=Sesamum radiatum TaxID=300843 RepID=A0AAW2JKS6_SESRA